MDILLVLCGLLAAFVIASFTCARSYFAEGRLLGMQEAVRELNRGISAHYELDGQVVPERVAIALKAFYSVFERPCIKKSTASYYAQLWIVGNAIGEAIWIKGHAAGVRRKAPTQGKIRVDFSLAELLQLSWLAHLGFQHMMPNYRGFEIHRFSGAEDACEGARAVAKIEAIIPAKERPFADFSAQAKGRQKLICDWWQEVPNKLTA